MCAFPPRAAPLPVGNDTVLAIVLVTVRVRLGVLVVVRTIVSRAVSLRRVVRRGMVPSVVIRPLVVVLAVVGVLLMVVVLMLRVLPAHPALELLDHRLSTLLRQRRGGVLTRIFVSILVRHETERIQTQVGEGFPLRKLLGLGFGGTVVVPTLLVLGIAFVRLLRVKRFRRGRLGRNERRRARFEGER